MEYLWRVPHALDGRALAAAVGALPATPLDLGFGHSGTQRHVRYTTSKFAIMPEPSCSSWWQCNR